MATVAVNNSTNAALLAIRILGSAIPRIAMQVEAYTDQMECEVNAKNERMRELGWLEYAASMTKVRDIVSWLSRKGLF